MTLLPGDAAHGGVNIGAWTATLTTATISAETAARAVRGTSVTLDIPLDQRESLAPTRPRGEIANDAEARSEAPLRPVYAKGKEPSRRDSLKRREALLKGKEGSRRRQKWENDRLLGNPWAQPPEPGDWQVHPTHPVHAVPYFLAPLWDERQAQAKIKAAQQARDAARRAEEAHSGRVPKELRDKLKRSKGARGLLQDLEEQVRDFVKKWEEREKRKAQDGLTDADSSEDEEIVFVGRNGQMNDMHMRRDSLDNLQKEKLVFDSPISDQGASFGRWLVHNIAAYYDLHTWSVTTRGNPPRREAYVGIKSEHLKCAPSLGKELPRPLWVMV